MDPYGRVRHRVRTARGRFWTWLDRQGAALGTAEEPPPDAGSEPALVADQHAWLSARPVNWTRLLPVNRGSYGVILVTEKRLLLRRGSDTIVHLETDSESFQQLQIERIDDRECRLRHTGSLDKVADMTITSRVSNDLVEVVRTLQRKHEQRTTSEEQACNPV